MISPSRSRTPIERGAIDIQARTAADDPALVRIRNEARPWFPPMSLEEYRWQADPANSPADEVIERWVARVEGEIVGLYVLSEMSGIERDNTYVANIGVIGKHRAAGIGSALYDHMLERARRHTCTRLYGQVSRDHDDAQAFLQRRGFAKTGRAHRMSRLVIDEANTTGYDRIEQALASGNIKIKTLADPGMSDESMLREIHRLTFESARDIPSTEAFNGPPFEMWMKWMSAPGNSLDQQWIALDGDRPVGTASVSRRGDDSSFNDYTGVDREYRGRGIARALKFKTIRWARANGIKTMFTANDYENQPMLSINIPLGYVEVPAELEMVKDL